MPARPFFSRFFSAVAIALSVGFFVPIGEARADEEGESGRVAAVRVNTAGSDDHPSFHGSVTIRHGNGKRSEYLWGGSTCPAQKIGDGHVRLLTDALANRGRIVLVPRFVPGEAGARCLVAFDLRAG